MLHPHCVTYKITESLLLPDASHVKNKRVISTQIRNSRDFEDNTYLYELPYLPVLGIEPRASCIVGKCSTTVRQFPTNHLCSTVKRKDGKRKTLMENIQTIALRFPGLL